MDEGCLQASQIRKSYAQGSGALEILKGIDLVINRGEALGIVGASGAGKSTFLQILGTLDRPDSGSLFFGGRDLCKMDDDELALFRNEKMGFVFQFHHLIQELTALENVGLPGMIRGQVSTQVEKRAQELLNYFGLSSRLDHYPSELSGGELQRVAIARALFNRPQFLFADEPTGNLDSANAELVQNLFFEMQKEFGLTLVIVTHDQRFASRFPRLCRMRDGLFESV